MHQNWWGWERAKWVKKSLSRVAKFMNHSRSSVLWVTTSLKIDVSRRFFVFNNGRGRLMTRRPQRIGVEPWLCTWDLALVVFRILVLEALRRAEDMNSRGPTVSIIHRKLDWLWFVLAVPGNFKDVWCKALLSSTFGKPFSKSLLTSIRTWPF